MDFELDAVPSLAGQKILVTGGAGLVGSEIASLFVARGADVAVHARTAERAAQAVSKVSERAAQLRRQHAVHGSGHDSAGSRGIFADEQLSKQVHPVVAVLEEQGAAEGLVAAAEKALRGLTGVINCAAMQPVVPFADLDENSWDSLFAVNVAAAHQVTRVAVERMQRGGWITHVSSIEGERPATGHAHYAVSKAALNMHAQAAALELGPRGVRVNAVAPGLISRPGIESEWPEGVTSWRTHAPLKELVQPLQVAAVCAMLASPAAGAVTGQVLAVDNGMLSTPGW